MGFTVVMTAGKNNCFLGRKDLTLAWAFVILYTMANGFVEDLAKNIKWLTGE